MTRKNLLRRLENLGSTPPDLADLERVIDGWLATPGADDVLQALGAQQTATVPPDVHAAALQLSAAAGPLDPRQMDRYPDTWLAALALTAAAAAP